jgi:UDP-N-acetylglucosamine--N-acetylmuramyl-(pentapeptide) pyrophosphoryl-undecaprenol N-acetylglucosamine transferase
MKILLTGGGSGGHFYPVIAVAEELQALAREHKIADIELYYMSSTPYNSGVLFNNKIIYKRNSAGKVRRYFSILNFFDLFKTGWGIVKSLWEIFLIYPDVVFGKGGYASFPALFAARILRIPVVIHESDTVPGKTNLWAGKFAQKIAVSYPDAAHYFPKDRVAFTGNPIRKDLLMPLSTNAHEYLNLDPNIPTILILGGSLGSRIINEAIMEALPKLLETYQVIHQTGKHNIEEVKKIAEAILFQSAHKDRYRPYDYMDSLTLRSAAGAAGLVISRAGSAIFEIASWGVPALIIPIRESNGNHQAKNAFAYARAGAATVVEEGNLTGNILFAEIHRIMDNPEISASMRNAAQAFIKRDAARLIAEEIMKIALRHSIEIK